MVELGKAAQDRDAALKERDTALRERDTALSEREAAWAERGAVKRDLDSMWKAQDAALKHLGDAPRSNALSRTDSRDG